MRKAPNANRRKSPKTFPTNGLARPREAAGFLAVGKSTVYALIKSRELEVVMIRREMRIPWHSLWAYIGRPVSVEAGSLFQILTDLLPVLERESERQGIPVKELVAKAVRCGCRAT